MAGTPLGSTAYTLASGGPMLAPGTEGLVLTPLAPHGGVCPPVVTAPTTRVAIRLDPGFGGARVEIDGHVARDLPPLEPGAFTLGFEPEFATLVSLGEQESTIAGLRRRRILIDSPRMLAREDRARARAEAAERYRRARCRTFAGSVQWASRLCSPWAPQRRRSRMAPSGGGAAPPPAVPPRRGSRRAPQVGARGFSDPRPRIPHAIGRGGDIAALLWGFPLTSPPRKDISNKILWVSRVTRRPSTALRIHAQRMRGTRALGAPVRRRVDGGPGPSIIDLPRAGCWRLRLRWSGHTDRLDLRYVHRG